MTRSESKYFNTALRMDDAFLELLEQKDFAYISVKEICTRAGVNRSTFYLHYETIGDLLRECMERSQQQFVGYFAENEGALLEKIRSGSLEELMLITPEYLEPYLRYIRENKRIFQAYYRNPALMGADVQYQRLYQSILAPILTRFRVPEEKRRYMMDFYMQGIMAIIQRWLAEDCQLPIQELCGIIVECVVPEYKNMEKATR